MIKHNINKVKATPITPIVAEGNCALAKRESAYRAAGLPMKTTISARTPYLRRHRLIHYIIYDSYALSRHKRQGNASERLMHKKRSLLPDTCLSAARGPRRPKDSHFSPSQIMNASSKFPRHQCSSEERRRSRDSNRLSIGPLKNIAMPIRCIRKSSKNAASQTMSDE